jgi:hypothetical protein
MESQMTTTNLYQAAVADMAARKTHYGAARHVVASGAELICSVKRVAGRSIIAGHYRTTWHLVPVGEQYSKGISRAAAVKLLAEG